jgi:hypothetical protein
MANIIQKDSNHWEVYFENFPDWIIPLIHVVPQFSTDDIYDWNDLTFFYDFNYFWEKVENKHYRLYIYLSGNLYDISYNPIPLYVDLSCWIMNTNFRNSVQHSLGS